MKRFLLIISVVLNVVTACAQPRHHFDATNPDVHDPVMALGEDGRYYIFSTGMGINVMSSADRKTWRQETPVFEEARNSSITGSPSWATDSVPRFRGHIWAPDISRHGDKWYLYYSCSSFGKNGSAIGLATNKVLDPKSPDYKWEDQGPVIVSHRGQDDYNCIDPNLFVNDNANANPCLFFGSFWDGIQMVKLDKDLKTPLAQPRTVARRYVPAKNANTATPYIEVVNGDTVEAGENAIEAPFVIKHDGWYYLFVSWDYCCRGKKSTYKTVYGRSRNIEGPYLDKDGKDMAQGGGTFLVGPDKNYFGVGHCAAYELDGQWCFLSHAYDISKKGQSKLYLKKLYFTKDNWIELER